MAAAVPRAEIDIDTATDTVAPLIADIRVRGTEALLEYAERFDGVRPPALRIPESEISAALQGLDPQVRAALETAISHVRAGHEGQLPHESVTEIIPGGTVTQRWIPVRRVGLYVPGGLVPYPSSVIMNVVAAQVAGVPEIALASPPQKDFGGGVHPTILAACALLGVTEVYAVGGAQAIALFAYGVHEGETDRWLCEPVDTVTGPGNIYVAAAKRLVRGVCGIDAEAGTTEIGIVADASANPLFVATDLISQAEHDPAAAAVLFTDSDKLAAEVDAELERLVFEQRHSERIRQSLSGQQSGVVVLDTHEQVLAAANAYGAEHLEIHTAEALSDAAQIHNAGAIFIGPYTPVPLGDYIGGSNHVLPTGGTARYNSGLGVMSFLKSVQQLEYSNSALEAVTDQLVTLAESENLPAHGRSALARRSVE